MADDKKEFGKGVDKPAAQDKPVLHSGSTDKPAEKAPPKPAARPDADVDDLGLPEGYQIFGGEVQDKDGTKIPGFKLVDGKPVRE